jgi:hypothetical protein
VSTSGGSLPFRLAVGGTVGQGVVLGATLYGAGTTIGGSRASLNGARGEFAGLSFLVDWYPSPASGWHVGGDLGLGAVALSNSVGSGGDLALSVFGGYDWWIAEQWSFGVLLTASGGSQAAIIDSNGDDTGYRLKPGSIGVLASFAYH